MGGYLLKHPEILSTLDDEAAKLWIWHAIEEIEHCAVAFDVYQHIYGDDRVRRMIMRGVTTGFASLFCNTLVFARQEKKFSESGREYFWALSPYENICPTCSRIFILF